MKTQSPQYIADRAIELRKTQTPVEELLWCYLRHRKLDGFKFYRQHPIGKFIVDFYCPEVKFAIELDGEIHNNRQEYDKTRDSKLRGLGLRIFRIKNEQIVSDIHMTLQEIRQHLLQ